MKKILKNIGILLGVFFVVLVSATTYQISKLTPEQREENHRVYVQNRAIEDSLDIVEAKYEKFVEDSLIKAEGLEDAYFYVGGPHRKVMDEIWARVHEGESYEHNYTSSYILDEAKQITRVYTNGTIENKYGIIVEVKTYADIDKDNNIIKIEFK